METVLAGFSFPRMVAVGVTLLTAALSVLLHYEALRALSSGLNRLPGRARPRVVVLVLALLVIHNVEIWVFALAYYLAPGGDELGRVIAGHSEIEISGLIDHVYFSAMTYTTVGFGDMVPQGPIRLLVGVEATTGLVLITWSASFTYLVMERFWNGS